MFLPRLQRDPRPASYNVQTTVLPMDMYVHISAYFCSILSAYRLMFIVGCALSCNHVALFCHYCVTFVFTVNTERNRHRNTCTDRFCILNCQSTSQNVGCHITLVLLSSVLQYAIMRITSIRFAFDMKDIYKIPFFGWLTNWELF